MSSFLNKAKKVSSFLILGLLLVALQFAAQSPVAHAQSAPTSQADCSQGEKFVPSVDDTGTSRGSCQPDQGNKCSFSPSTWDLCLSNVIYVFTVGIGSTFAFIGAYFFNIAVSLALNSLAYAQGFISQGWTMARDLANMGFILALVYIAYTILLRAESGGTMRMLAWVIVMALIINFSFFFTRLVIDAGNILAVQFYNAIPTDGRTLADTLGNTYGGSTVNNTAQFLTNNNNTFARTKDLTHPIMNGLNMQGLFSTAIFDKWYTDQNKGVSGGINVFLTLSFIYIAVGAMYFILAVMFLAAGIKFLARIVVLWFLIVASPLAFLAKTTSLTGKYYDLWQRYLITHTFYPVVFLFIFLFISLVMKDLNPTGAAGGLTQSIIGDLSSLSTQNTASAISIIAASIASVAIRLGFVVAMLYIGMRAADRVGVIGATAASSFTNWVSRRGTGVFFGGSAWAMRNSIGLAGQRVAQRAEEKKWDSQKGVRGALGSAALRTGLGLSRKTFDARNVPSVRKGLGLVGIDTTEGGGKGGYSATFDARTKKRAESAEKPKTTKAPTSEKAVSDTEKEKPTKAANEVSKVSNSLESTDKSINKLTQEINKNARTTTGDTKPDTYNPALTTSSAPSAGAVSQSDRDAAAQLRDKKNTGGNIKDLLGKTKTQNPTSTNPEDDEPPTGGGGNTPRGGGSGGKGNKPPGDSPSTNTPPIQNTSGPTGPGPGSNTNIAGNTGGTLIGEQAVRRVLDEMRSEVGSQSTRSAPLPLNEVTARPNTPEVKSYVDNKPSAPSLAETPKVSLDEKSLDTLRGVGSGLKEIVKSTEKTVQHIASAPQQTIPKVQKLPEQGNINVDQNELNNAANDNTPPSENRNAA